MASKELSTKTLVKRLANLVEGLWLQYVLAVGGAVLGFLMTILIPSLVIRLAWQALEGQAPHFFFCGYLVCLGAHAGYFTLH